MAAVRSRRGLGTRKLPGGSRSGDYGGGLLRSRRSPRSSNHFSCVAVVLVFLLLVMLVVVATVQTTLEYAGVATATTAGGIGGILRKRQLQQQEQQQQFYDESHNSDETTQASDDTEEVEEEQKEEEEEEEELEKEEEHIEEEEEEVQEEIDAAKAKMEAQEAAAREEARRQQEREDQIRREKDELLQQLREEKAKLERQLKEEEEQRKRAEEAAREAARLKEEEERRKEEELARLKKLEEEREAERLELLRKEEERVKAEEAKRRQEEEEARRQRELEQEQERQRQREEQEILRKEQERLQQEQERLRQEQQARLAAQRQRPHAQQAHAQQATVHHETTKQKNVRTQYPGMPDQSTISFCDFMRKKPSNGVDMKTDKYGFINPAVLVLGMEDTSTELVWHVISQILYPGRKTARRTHELQTKATQVDYGQLHKPGAEYQNEFWTKVSDKSKGKWMVHVFCQQQENDVAAGFPWLTSPDVITDNTKAQDTLELVKQLPKGSLKILRVKRNSLDVLIRQAQQEQHAPMGAPISMDRRKIFGQLRKLKAEQDAFDQYLQDNNIPHLVLDFETMFPYDHWTDLVQAVQSFQGSNPSHINVDWRQLNTPLENQWREILRYLKVFRPLTMFDILQMAMQTHEVNTFWKQKEAVDKFGYISTALQGTHYYPLVRKEQIKSQFKKTQGFNDFWNEGDEM